MLTPIERIALIANIEFTPEQNAFAKLIIQECVFVHTDNYGVDIISRDLENHFGIKLDADPS